MILYVQALTWVINPKMLQVTILHHNIWHRYHPVTYLSIAFNYWAGMTQLVWHFIYGLIRHINVNIQPKIDAHHTGIIPIALLIESFSTDMEFILGNCEVNDEDTSSLLVHSEFAGSISNIEEKTESIDQNSPNSGSYLYTKSL